MAMIIDQVSAGRPSTSASATPTSSPAIAPCQHPLTSTTRCGQGVIPMSRFCPKHILEQPNQVLFRACGVTTDVSDGPCETPVPALFPHSTCVFHTRLLPIQVLLTTLIFFNIACNFYLNCHHCSALMIRLLICCRARVLKSPGVPQCQISPASSQRF